MGTRLRLCLVASLTTSVAGLPSALAAPRKLAVLELHDSAQVGDSVTRFLGEHVRATALVLPAADWFVVTRENLVALLPPGTDLANCAFECEIETGRAIGADVVITGEVTRVGKKYTVSLSAHRVDSGQLVAQEIDPADGVKDLDKAARAAAGRLLERVQGLRTAQAEPAVLVVRGPEGHTAHIDGVEVGRLPLEARRVPPGRREVTVEGAPCFGQVTATADLSPGERREMDLMPPPKQATLKVEALDAAGLPTRARVSVDGVAVGDAPGTFQVSVCAERVEVSDGRASWRDRLDLKGGGTLGLTATLRETRPSPPPSAAPPPSSPSRPAPSSSSSSSMDEFRYSAFLWGTGIGLGLLGLGAVTAWSNHEAGRNLRADPNNQALREDVRKTEMASDLLYAAAILALIVGLMPVVIRPPKESRTRITWDPDLREPPKVKSEPSLRWGVGPGSVGLEGIF